MIRFAIYGAGGFGKEVRGMLHTVNPTNGLTFAGFIDDNKKVLPLAAPGSYDDVLFAIADPKIRQKVVAKMATSTLSNASLIDSNVLLHPSVKIGKGAIICPGVKFTVDIQVGDFVIINLNATIGHDVIIGDFCSIMPSANISGNVKLGKGVLVGAGASILQGLSVGDNSIVGAGAIVTKSVPAGVTVMGVPARIKN
ncbi:dTDP-4-amino-4,6-dideoxy-D-glucose acetyltransferase VioB [soil metagenome]